MEKDLDPEIIKTTQNLLGKYVKRPPLSEKLLKKPPFRFLHDVITTVLKTTGFFGNLFEDEELISDNVKDRDSKIAFLTKVIYVTSAATGKSLSAKPSKIVAGQEAEKTNELLQCLAQALDDKLSSDKAVAQYKDSLKSTHPSENKTKESTKPIKKVNDSKKLTSKSSERLTSQKNDNTRSTGDQDKGKLNDVKSKKKENGSTKGDGQLKKTQQSKTVVKKNVKEQRDGQKDDKTQPRTKNSTPNVTDDDKAPNFTEKEKPNSLHKLLSQDSDISVERDNVDVKLDIIPIESPKVKQDDQDKLNASFTTTDNDLKTPASHIDVQSSTPQNTVLENKSFEINNIRQISVADIDLQEYPNTNNNESAAPKSLETDINIAEKSQSLTLSNTEPEERNDNLNAVKVPVTSANDTKIPRPPSVRPSSVRPSSSRPGAPRMREKIDNVLKDPDNLLIGKVNIIAENTYNEEEEDTSLIVMDRAETTASSEEQQELQLMPNEHGHLVQQILDSQKELSQFSGKTEIEWQFGAQKAREAMKQDVEQLRFNIQALSRVANPLGKLLDHIQEDVEVMRQELQQWSNIYEDVNKEMVKQKTLNEDALMPFHTKLKHLESDIEEKHDKINDLKILIHKNALRIEKLLSSGNVQ